MQQGKLARPSKLRASSVLSGSNSDCNRFDEAHRRLFNSVSHKIRLSPGRYQQSVARNVIVLGSSKCQVTGRHTAYRPDTNWVLPPCVVMLVL